MADLFSKIGAMSMTSHRSITFVNIKEKVISQEAKYFSEQIECDTLVSDRINPDWDALQANHMSSSFKTYNMIDLFVSDP
jgi:hypothetical protein